MYMSVNMHYMCRYRHMYMYMCMHVYIYVYINVQDLRKFIVQRVGLGNDFARGP